MANIAGLRLTMFAYGGLLLASGLVAALLPDRLAAFAGRESTNTFLLGSWGWLTALLGLGVLLAGRDPVRHILWVRLALFSFVLGAAYDLLHYLSGTVAFGVITLDLTAYLLFGALFLLFYPRAPRMAPLNVRVARGPLYTDLDYGGLFLRQSDAWVPYLLPAREPAASGPPSQASGNAGAGPLGEESPGALAGGASGAAEPLSEARREEGGV